MAKSWLNLAKSWLNVGQISLENPLIIKGPSCTNFGTGSKFGMEVAKRYREDSELLVSLGKKGRRTVQTEKNNGGSKPLEFLKVF